MELQQAKSLEEIYLSLSPEPLRTPEELKAFYRSEVNQVRGDDAIRRMKLNLPRAHGGNYYKALLMGHSGVGKSTELFRLAEEVKDKFKLLYLSATADLDPVNFKPLDVFLWMVTTIVEETAKPKSKGGAGKHPSKEKVEKLWRWFAQEKVTVERSKEAELELEAGAGLDEESLWGKLLNLVASVKGSLRFAASRTEEVEHYRLTQLDPLIEVSNELLVECNRLLREAQGQEWLFIGDDFEKVTISIQQVEDLFVRYASVFQKIQTHWIFTIPIALGYSSKRHFLPTQQVFILPDSPMYWPNHDPHLEGRSAMLKLLQNRVDPALFEPDQMERMAVASGGNLRDLFNLVSFAADTALLNNRSQINPQDSLQSIRRLRTDYERSLGENPFDIEKVSYPQKAERLVQIYNQDPVAEVPDSVLYSMLLSRAVQEFNGQRWFGVHPLVVDILARQGKLSANAEGMVPGGLL